MKKLLILIPLCWLCACQQPKPAQDAPEDAAAKNIDSPKITAEQAKEIAARVDYTNEEGKVAVAELQKDITAEKFQAPPVIDVSMNTDECTHNLSARDTDHAYFFAKSSMDICYKNALVKSPDYKIITSVKVDVLPNGGVDKVEFEPAISEDRLNECLVNAMKQLRYPKTTDQQPGSVKYTLKLNSRPGVFEDLIVEGHDHDHDHDHALEDHDHVEEHAADVAHE